MKTIFLSAAYIVLLLQAAPAQNVGIGTTTPQSQLHIGNNGINELIIGRDKNAGGYTSLLLGTSSVSSGYGYIQAVQSAGSTWGNLILNPISGNVGVGTTAPHTSAILDISAESKGVLFPRMTTMQRNTITNPAHGLHIFNTNIGSLQYYDTVFNVWTSYCNTCGVFTDTIWADVNAYIVPSGYNKVRLFISNLVKVSGTATAPAISLVNVLDNGAVIIENFGGIYGKGGDGGDGGATSTSNASITCLPAPASNGKPGTDAIHSTTSGKNIQLTILNYGIIAGGGGGGGGGNYGAAIISAGGGGGGGQGGVSLGGKEGTLKEPNYLLNPLPFGTWECADVINGTDATNGGIGSYTIRGDFGTGSTGAGGGSRGGYGGTLGMPGQNGFGTGGTGGAAGKAIRFNNGNNTITNIGAGIVYGVVD
jgi:hypothetical protein